MIVYVGKRVSKDFKKGKIKEMLISSIPRSNKKKLILNIEETEGDCRFCKHSSKYDDGMWVVTPYIFCKKLARKFNPVHKPGFPRNCLEEK